MIPESYSIKRIRLKEAGEYIREHHYSHGHHNGASPCYGLFDDEMLIGVCMFATPCSENVRASVFGVEHKDAVVELHRLHILDVTPRNTETWYLSRCFRMLRQDRPQTKAVISFADPTEGHEGTIYKALNGIYCGRSSRARFFRDGDGRLRHPRQNGRNITMSEAKERGWTPVVREGKHRFLWILDRRWKSRCRIMKQL
jgi:hypothetical protein